MTLAFKLAIGVLFSELLCTYCFYLPSCKHLQRWNNVLNTARPKLSGAGQLPSLLVLRYCHCEHVFTNLNNRRWTMQMNEGKSTCLMQNINLQNEWCLQLWYGRLATVSFIEHGPCYDRDFLLLPETQRCEYSNRSDDFGFNPQVQLIVIRFCPASWRNCGNCTLNNVLFPSNVSASLSVSFLPCIGFLLSWPFPFESKE